MNEKLQKNMGIFVILIAVGIALRFVCMAMGHNYDFESYCVVGDIVSNFHNVYAETARYNYGPVFMVIQGCLYLISSITGHTLNELMYRVLMVSVLTAADLGITVYIAKRFSLRAALIFFLNPISIFITGFHNQFDNIAILIALISVLFYNEDKKFNAKDIGFVISFSLCLMTKHILFLMPVFILIRHGLCWKKKILYACAPVAIFLLSFVPFALNSAAFTGIVNNVFLYRSYNNAPLLSYFYNWISFPDNLKIFVFAALMIAAAILTRKQSYEYQVFIYLIAMVSFSSAIANQYLAIPMAALCVLDTGAFRYVYMGTMTVFLAINENGLNLLNAVLKRVPETVGKFFTFYAEKGAYILAAWLLCAALIYVIVKKQKYIKV